MTHFLLGESLVHESFFTSIGQVVILVAASLMTSLIVWVAKRQGALIKRAEQSASDVSEIKSVLITPKPTSLVPNPPMGLVDIVAGHTDTLTEMATQISSVASDVGAVDDKVKKLFPNGENTNDPGDLLARGAKANGTWLESPPPPNPTRRRSDRKPPPPVTRTRKPNVK